MSKKHKHNNRPITDEQEPLPQAEQDALDQEEELAQEERPQEALAEEPEVAEQADAERPPELVEGLQGQTVPEVEEQPQEESLPEQQSQEEPVYEQEPVAEESALEEPQEEQTDAERPPELAEGPQGQEEPEVEEQAQPEEALAEQVEPEAAEQPLEEPVPVQGEQLEGEPQSQAPVDGEQPVEGEPVPQEGAAPATEGEQLSPEEIAKREEEARIAAEKAAEKKRKKEERRAKTRAWFKKHKVFVIVTSVILVVAMGLAAGHLATTWNVAFIHTAEGLAKAVEKGKKTEFVFKNDVIYDGDINLGKVNIDLNDHTLEVKGDLTIEGDGFVGKKKTVWSEPGLGGAVIVEGNLTLTGARDLYSTFTVAGNANATDLNVYGDFKAANLTLSGDLDVRGNVDAKVNLSANSTAKVYGQVTSINGGNEVVAYGKIGQVTGATELYIYPDSQVDSFADVGNYYFVQYLEAPHVYVAKIDNKQVLIISHVRHADGYTVTVAGIEGSNDVPEKAGDNLRYEMPNLDPGNYAVTVKPYSNNGKVFVSQASTTVAVSYYVQLATPTFEINTDEEGKVKVVVQPVEHAASFVVDVNGTTRKVNAGDNASELDISDLITEVGSYNVIVYAVQSNGNYTDSEKALKTYVHTETATVSATALQTEDGVKVTIVNESGVAYYYQVQLLKAGLVVSTVNVRASDGNTYLFADQEGDTVKVKPLTKGYYEAGAEVSATVTAEEQEPQPDQGEGDEGGEPEQSQGDQPEEQGQGDQE